VWGNKTQTSSAYVFTRVPEPKKAAVPRECFGVLLLGEG